MKLFSKCTLTFLMLMTIGSFSWANNHSRTSSDLLSAERRQKIVEQINEELHRNLRIDSLVNTPVVVAPEVYFNTYNDSDDYDSMKNVVMILGLVLPFVFSFAIVWLVLWFKRKKLHEKFLLINKAIEEDYELPEAFYSEKTYIQAPPNSSGTHDRVKTRFYVDNTKKITASLIWIAAGLTGAIFFLVADADEMAALCLLPILIGVAKFLATYLPYYNSYHNSDKE